MKLSYTEPYSTRKAHYHVILPNSNMYNNLIIMYTKAFLVNFTGLHEERGVYCNTRSTEEHD